MLFIQFVRFAAIRAAVSASDKHWNPKAEIGFFVRALVGVWIAVCLSGCAATTDPTPFADSTRAAATSVRAAGAQTRNALDGNPANQARASEFELHWAARNRAMAAATDYGNSLVVVFKQSQAVQPSSLSTSLQRLASALGVGGAINPGAGAAVGMLVASADTIAFIHAQIELVAASRTIDEAMTRAQPVIDRIAEFVIADTSDIETIIRASAAVERLEFAEKFNDSLAFSQSINRRRDEIRRASYAELTPSALDELARIESLRSSVQADLTPYFEKLAAIDRQESDAIHAINEARDAIESWAAAHRSLASSITPKSSLAAK
ncbi:MAG: hypothetical protein ACREJD_00755 [Phycisphaerales bacterium]